MSEIDRERIAAVKLLRELGCVFSAGSWMPIPAISISRSNAFRSSIPVERDQWRGVRDGSIGLIGDSQCSRSASR